MATRFNADFDKAVIVTPDDYAWTPSPAPGVDRVRLDRIGDEIARATSFVRYAPNTKFPEHAHDGGEEFYVVAGEFADEHGRYPSGCYVRNPIGTKHSPSIGPTGCVIWVKLRQFAADDLAQKVVMLGLSPDKGRQSTQVETRSLHKHGGEDIAEVSLPPLVSLAVSATSQGEEFIVLDGAVGCDGQHCPEGSWLRFPSNFKTNIVSGVEGCHLLRKRGHLGSNFIHVS